MRVGPQQQRPLQRLGRARQIAQRPQAAGRRVVVLRLRLEHRRPPQVRQRRRVVAGRLVEVAQRPLPVGPVGRPLQRRGVGRDRPTRVADPSQHPRQQRPVLGALRLLRDRLLGVPAGAVPPPRAGEDIAEPGVRPGDDKAGGRRGVARPREADGGRLGRRRDIRRLWLLAALQRALEQLLGLVERACGRQQLAEPQQVLGRRGGQVDYAPRVADRRLEVPRSGADIAQRGQRGGLCLLQRDRALQRRPRLSVAPEPLQRQPDHQRGLGALGRVLRRRPRRRQRGLGLAEHEQRLRAPQVRRAQLRRQGGGVVEKRLRLIPAPELQRQLAGVKQRCRIGVRHLRRLARRAVRRLELSARLQPLAVAQQQPGVLGGGLKRAAQDRARVVGAARGQQRLPVGVGVLRVRRGSQRAAKGRDRPLPPPRGAVQQTGAVQGGGVAPGMA